MRFIDANNNSLPSNVQVVPGDSLAIFAVDNSGIPLVCNWSLNYRGGMNTPSSTTQGNLYPVTAQFSNIDRLGARQGSIPGATGNGSQVPGGSYFGTLDGLINTYRPQYSVGPATSTIYRTPQPTISGSTETLSTYSLDLVVTATPVDGEKARSIYIHVENITPHF